ncbi:MAG TPA: hypothetical protein VE442_18345 [Jatrophihabitans sp.]|jgi:hypothetical protein|nr:hypothetical protein [Jatrophihabitans sp.]
MTDPEQGMTLHDRFYALLLERVRADRYPSTTMLDMLEVNMLGYEREELVNVLLEKVAQDRFPSIPMLQRIIRITQSGLHSS